MLGKKNRNCDRKKIQSAQEPSPRISHKRGDGEQPGPEHEGHHGDVQIEFGQADVGHASAFDPHALCIVRLKNGYGIHHRTRERPVGDKFDGHEKSGATSSGDESERSAANLAGIERGDGRGGGEGGDSEGKEQRTRGERRAGIHRPGGAERGVKPNRNERHHRRVGADERTQRKTAPECRHDNHERKQQQQERRKSWCDRRHDGHNKVQERNERTACDVGAHSAPRHSTFPPIDDSRAKLYWSRTTTLSAAPVASVTVSRTKPGPSGAKNSVRADFFAASGMPLRSTLRGGVPPSILIAIGSGTSPSLPDNSRLAPSGGKTMWTFAAMTSPAFAADAKRRSGGGNFAVLAMSTPLGAGGSGCKPPPIRAKASNRIGAAAVRPVRPVTGAPSGLPTHTPMVRLPSKPTAQASR